MLNLASLKTPGVYVEEVSKFPPSVASVETAIPAFIGYTEKAEKDNVSLHADGQIPVLRISSFAEYVEYFGGPPAQKVKVAVDNSGVNYIPVSVSADKPSNYRMYHAVRMFYANGGGVCYIVSVGPYEDPESISLSELGSNDDETGGLDRVRKIDEVTLLVFPDAAGLVGTDPDSKAEYYALLNQGLQQSEEMGDRMTLLDVRNTRLDDAVTEFRNANLSQTSLKYGAAYIPWVRSIYNYHTTDDSIELNFTSGSATAVSLGTAKADATHGPKLTSAFLARLYTLLARERVILPPSPAMAGIYAAIDNSRGVWKAPANVSVADIIEPVWQINEERQRELNVHESGKSINAIRSFTGKGTLVWGARTLAGNDSEWRYVSVRRLFNMVEESAKKATEPFVFEPNDANTWVKVQAMIENYLNTLWRVGALQGAKPEHAYYVSVGLGKTMTPLDIAEGRMIVEIGMAVVRPAEFIVLRFSHKLPES